MCAGKFYKGRRAKERDAARKEIELMNYLHHPKLVQCLAAYDQKPEMVMVMELCVSLRFNVLHISTAMQCDNQLLWFVWLQHRRRGTL